MMEVSPVLNSGDVSRSGRIRKKSTKLADFTDDIEPRPKKTPPVQRTPRTPDVYAPRTLTYTPAAALAVAAEEEATTNTNSDLPESGNEDGEMTATKVDQYHIRRAPQRSIYMTEKSSKKQKLLKDGTIVLSKAQRKDKGKPRYTAYMLWSKEARQQIMQTNPDIDFASASKRLGEMWTNVPENQKLQWKKRAKRLQTKIKKNYARAAAMVEMQKRYNLKPVSVSTARRAAKRIESEEQLKEQSRDLPLNKKTQALIGSTTEKQTIKPPTFRPADIAAHLKLLGDSLECIGQRLKEHEGQITVSGSLSVLLDSLLCSLGPLICLTSHIPGFGDKLQHLGPTFSNTLDNIAYVMPGL